MADLFTKSPLTPALFYLDPFAALDFLERAFGFERVLVLTDEQGNLAHSQMNFRGAAVMIGSEWSDDHRSPASLGRKCTQTVHVALEDGIDAHCERARAAGAEVIAEPDDQFYGDRTYRARDPEGHIWTFSLAVRRVGRAEAEQASGLTIEAKDWE